MMHLNILQIPVPKDIPLDLPLPKTVLIILLIVSFLLHILFVNLMVGGSLLTMWFEIKGLRKKEYDTLAREIAQTITVNKSLAVVLGVAPLLSINALYTIYFYSANALTGLFWISVIPTVIVAFLLLYAHKYLWDKLQNNKALHVSIIGFAVFLFFMIPLIFLTNINLMLFPEKWNGIQGFFSALTLPNVFPRYFHFLTASLALTGLFLTWFFGRKSYKFEEKVPGISRYQARKKTYSLAFAATVMQLFFGPFLLLTLPTKGIAWDLILVILAGASVAIVAMIWMWKEITGPKETLGKRFYWIAAVLGGVVLFMGTGRHLYRANALIAHQEVMAEVTKNHKKMVEQAKIDALKPKPKEKKVSLGEQLFRDKCTVCHNMETRLVGPPVAEMIEIYKNDQATMKKWIKEPGRKRPDYPPMAGFPNLSEDELTKLTDYILGLKIQ
jgi:cytochrome c